MDLQWAGDSTFVLRKIPLEALNKGEAHGYKIQWFPLPPVRTICLNLRTEPCEALLKVNWLADLVILPWKVIYKILYWNYQQNLFLEDASVKMFYFCIFMKTIIIFSCKVDYGVYVNKICVCILFMYMYIVNWLWDS